MAAIFKGYKDPSFPRRRESRPWDSGNIQRLAEALEILDSRFHGNDERCGNQTIGQQQYSKILLNELQVLESRFCGNDLVSEGTLVCFDRRHSSDNDSSS